MPASTFHKSDCEPEDAFVPFDVIDELAGRDQHDAQQKFFNLLDAGPASETICVNRHRASRGNEELPVPRTLRMFDWYFLHEKAKKQNCTNPKSVYCHVAFLKECLRVTRKLPELGPGEQRVLAMGQQDVLLSSVRNVVENLRDSGKYTRVLYESKDVYVPGVNSLPQCLNTWYLSNNAPKTMMHAIRSANFENKTKNVLAAWGYQWRFLDHKVESRKQAVLFTEGNCFVPRQSFSPEEYWRQLAAHRFFLAPTGNSIFTPKVMEALLVLTIPIVQRIPNGGAWEELKNTYNWPIVIVDKWDEITPANLQRWWKELAPKLQKGRLHLTPDYWFNTVMHGTLPV